MHDRIDERDQTNERLRLQSWGGPKLSRGRVKWGKVAAVVACILAGAAVMLLLLDRAL